MDLVVLDVVDTILILIKSLSLLENEIVATINLGMQDGPDILGLKCDWSTFKSVFFRDL